MQRNRILRCCYAVLILALAVLVCILIFLLDKTFGFDEEWPVGKTLGEVMERYGPPDLVHDMGIDIAYNRSFGDSTVYSIRGSYKDSETVITSLNPDLSGSTFSGAWYRYPGAQLFASWARGKPLSEVLASVDQPLFCVPGATVVYCIETDYVVLSVEKRQDGGYFVSEATVETSFEKNPSWQPWDPALFGISAERSLRTGWLIGCATAGVLGIAAMTVPVFLRKRSGKKGKADSE